MYRFYLITSLLAIALYGWAQYGGHSLFAHGGERENRSTFGVAGAVHHK
jgi:hypothetical protein